MFIAEALPEFYSELALLLTKCGERELAAQLQGLPVVERCRCNDDFCSSFYTAQKPVDSYGAGHRCLELSSAQGMIILDLVNGKIMQVEVLFRDDVRAKLHTILP